MQRVYWIVGAFVLVFALCLWAITPQNSPSPEQVSYLLGKNDVKHYVIPQAGPPPHPHWQDLTATSSAIERSAAERSYVATLPKQTAQTATHTWVEAGPRILGGRTLDLAFDVTNPNTVLAGSASGGIWRTEDGGTTWQQVTAPGDQMSVTSIAQDPRPGQTHVWYAVGGELRGSAGTIQGISSGNYAEGLYKSVDSGRTWQVVPTTVLGSPRQFDSPFDYTSRVVVSPTTGSVFVASHAFGIYRSQAGGLGFEQVLGGATGTHLHTYIDVGGNGRLLASLSSLASNGSLGTDGGYFVSNDDGQTWEKMAIADLTDQHQISRVAIAPSNPNVGYGIAMIGRSSAGESFRFHKLDLQNMTAENRTPFLPDYAGLFFEGAKLHTLNNYALVLAVKPDDEDFILLGGVVLYRSRDGYASSIPTYDEARIGGYTCTDRSCIDRDFGNFQPNYWIDHHALAFRPDNPNELWTGHDNGVGIARDVRVDRVAWEAPNDDYNVSQFYHVAMKPEAGDPLLMGGLQDHGVHLVVDQKDDPASTSRFSRGKRLTFDDGAYVFFGEERVVTGLSNGKVSVLRYANPEKTNVESVLEAAFSGRSTPNFMPVTSGYRNYVHPMMLDPVDRKTLYYSDGSNSGITATVWRNSDIGGHNVSANWRRMDEWAAPSGIYYTAYGASTEPGHVLYLGGSSFGSAIVPKVYRIENANTSTATPVDVSIPNAPAGGFIHNIAVNPLDADEIMVVMSNYNLLGLYHSINGGQSYTLVEGNLEGDSGNGPSIRAATILPLTQVGDKRTVYMVATSAGLFSTTTLDGMNTVWSQEGFELMGGVPLYHVVSRPSDGKVLVGTHGRGLAVGDIDATQVGTEAAESLPEGFSLERNYPNPFRRQTTIPYSLAETSHVRLSVYDAQGKQVIVLTDTVQAAGTYHVPFEPEALPAGTYWYQIELAPVRYAGTTYRQTRSMVHIR